MASEGHGDGFFTSLRPSSEFPLPSLSTQQLSVAEIEAEQVLVAANRDLIARFEKMIQATHARVWGDDEPTPAEA